MKRRILSILPTILFLGLLTALVSVRSATSAQSIHSMAVEPGYLAQARLSIKCNTLREDLSGGFSNPDISWDGYSTDRPSGGGLRPKSFGSQSLLDRRSAADHLCFRLCLSATEHGALRNKQRC